MIFSVEAYHKKLSQLIAYKEGASLTQSSIDAVEKITTGSGKSQGVEFLARKKKGKTTGWVGYTLSKVVANLMLLIMLGVSLYV